MSGLVERLRAKHLLGSFEIEEQRREAADEIERLRVQLASARKALEPFAKMGSAMYVSGHCGGASPEDWPEKWSCSVQGFDGHHFHSPQQFGGNLTVADFRRAYAALIDEKGN